MKKTNLLFWAVLVVLTVGCSSVASSSEVAVLSQVIQTDCSFLITINGGKQQLGPNESTRLAVDQVGFGWQYDWSSSAGTLGSPGSGSSLFTAPETEGTVTVSVSVIDDQGCQVEAETTIEVASQAQPSATEVVNDIDIATAVSTATATPTMSPTATQTAAATSTVTSSATPSATFTSIPAFTQLPTHTPAPTVAAFQIWLKEPKDGTCVGAENAIFEWLATRPLNSIEGVNGEYFALNIWAKDTPVYSVSWIKDPIYEIENISDPVAAYTQEINCNSADGCFWNVDLIVSHVDRGSGWLPGSFTKIASSPVRNFCTELSPAPIPPTSTPQPLQPTPTPCTLPPSQCK